MKVYSLSFDHNVLPYIELIGGYKIKFKYGIEQKNFPEDQKAFIETPRPLKNSLWYTYRTLVVSESLFPLYEKAFANNAQILPLDVENNGQAFLINVTTSGNDWFSMEESIFDDYSDHQKKEGKFIHQRDMRTARLYAVDAVFIKDIIKAPIFNVIHNKDILGPFCTLGLFPEEEELAALILKYNIKGISLYENKLI